METIGQALPGVSSRAWKEEDIERVQILAQAIANTLERRQAEEALRESEARFRSLIESSPVSIVISQNGVILYGNAAFLQLFGFASNAGIAGQSLLELVVMPEKKEELLMRIRRRNAGKAVGDGYETIGMRKDGATFPFPRGHYDGDAAGGGGERGVHS